MDIDITAFLRKAVSEATVPLQTAPPDTMMVGQPFRTAFVGYLRDHGWRRSPSGWCKNNGTSYALSGAVVIEMGGYPLGGYRG